MFSFLFSKAMPLLGMAAAEGETAFNFTFWDFDAWSLLLALAILLGAMLIANLLRRYIKPLRTLMLPSALLGGFIVLGADAIFKAVAGHSMFASNILEYITYHGLGLGFISLALKWGGEKKNTKERNREIFDSGLAIVGTYLVQGILGLAITLGLYYVIPNVFPASGLILPMGYGQGPGQALNWGNIYEGRGFANGASFGLTVAAMGLISASIGGCIYYMRMRKQGKFVKGGIHENADETSGEVVNARDEIPMSESMDKLTVQIALIVLVYAATFGIMYGLRQLFLAVNPDPESFLLKTVDPLIWGFNFLVGTIVALVFRSVMKRLHKKDVMKRKYTNDFMLSRLGAFFFDLMVVASVAAIKIEAFSNIEFLLPMALMCVLGAFVTYFYLNVICKKLFPGYPDEQFLALWGNGAGTASTGVILVREVDPEFKAPAVMNIVYMPIWAILFGFPMLLFMGMAPDKINGDPTGWSWVTFGALIVFFVFINILLFRKFVFKKKAKATESSGDKPQ